MLAAYEAVLRGRCSPGWADTSMTYLRRWRDFCNGRDLRAMRSADAEGFLAKQRGAVTPATANRIRAVLQAFCGWACTGPNPFANVRHFGEPPPTEIVHCTRAERSAILTAADGDAEALAVWLGFYSGMRRGEIHRAKWSDVGRDTVIVPVSKTGRRRVLPLAAELRDRLEPMRPRHDGRIVPWPEPFSAWPAASQRLLDRLRLKCETVPATHVRWNAWRHTFGSLLAQEGVSIDKIASWLGNSPQVCKRHYAEFTPRDRHDDQIDRL